MPLKIWLNSGSGVLNAIIISVPVANANLTILGTHVKRPRISRALVSVDIVPKKSRKLIITKRKHSMMYVGRRIVSLRSRIHVFEFTSVGIHATALRMRQIVCHAFRKTAFLNTMKRIKTISSSNFSMGRLAMTSVLFVILCVLARWQVSDLHVNISFTSSVS